jgi:RNA-directed DNA polymerase
MNEFDQFVKDKLKVRYYIRYADDFALLSDNKIDLCDKLTAIAVFLSYRLRLSLHPDKIVLKTYASGVDFLGWVHFPNHRVLRTTPRRRAFQKIRDNPAEESLQSYFGLLSHGNSYELGKELLNWHGLWRQGI